MIREECIYLWTTGRGLYALLGLLIFGIFISPIMIEEGLISVLLVDGLFGIILIAGVFTTPCNVYLRVSMLVIAFSAIVTRLLHFSPYSDFAIAKADNILAAITIVVFSVLITKHFLIDKTLMRYRIAAAVAVYLLIGVLWGRLYEVVYLFNPLAFSMSGAINSFSLLYFSFVTLVTVGYGDIVPLSLAARSLAIFEGVAGQLYLVILISSLVSEFSVSANTISDK